MSRTIDTRFRAPRLAGLAVLSTGLFLAGCGGDGGGDVVGPGDDFGTFSVTVSGDINTTVSGSNALHTADFGPPWSVSLNSTEISLSIVKSSGRPEPGTYSLTAEGGETYALVQVESFSGASVSGTLTINSSSANQVSGSFDFTAVTSAGVEMQITVTGTFEAVPVI